MHYSEKQEEKQDTHKFFDRERVAVLFYLFLGKNRGQVFQVSLQGSVRLIQITVRPTQKEKTGRENRTTMKISTGKNECPFFPLAQVFQAVSQDYVRLIEFTVRATQQPILCAQRQPALPLLKIRREKGLHSLA